MVGGAARILADPREPDFSCETGRPVKWAFCVSRPQSHPFEVGIRRTGVSRAKCASPVGRAPDLPSLEAPPVRFPVQIPNSDSQFRFHIRNRVIQALNDVVNFSSGDSERRCYLNRISTSG